MSNEDEIQKMLNLTLEARNKTEKIEREIEQLRDTHKAMKTANDDRIHRIQEENQRLDDQLHEKEYLLSENRDEINEQIYKIKSKLLRRIVYCNLKNLLKETVKPEVPEYALTTVYVGKFCSVYTKISEGEKPVNKYEWIIEVNVPQQIRHSGLLEKVCGEFNNLHYSWGNKTANYFERDFPSEEKAEDYGKRHVTRICEKLIDNIRQVEKQIGEAEDQIDDVVDFRLINSVLDPNYSGTSKYRVTEATKHQLTVTPMLTSYERNIEKIQPYKISIKQQGYKLTISGHKQTNEAIQISYAIRRYFNTEFKAVEADTQHEIPDLR